MSLSKSPKNTPDKSLGQHWLFDEFALAAMADAAAIQPDDMVLEIGPGKGPLSKVLLQRGAKVLAVEFDPALARELRSMKSPKFDVVHQDILKFDFLTLPKGYKVVANVPYYITSKIVRLLLEADNPPATATLLVQKEVAERLAAQPGAMSLLSVAAQFYADVSLGQVVLKELFEPAPKVDSQIVHLKYTGPKFETVDTKKFFQLVKAGFGERRKKLRSSLAGGLHLEKQATDTLLQEAKIDPEARAQELSMNDWNRLYQVVWHPGIH